MGRGRRQDGRVVDLPIEPDCPTAATVATLHDLDEVLQLACFGDATVSLDGEVSCPDFGPPIPTPSPEWLTWGGCLNPPGAPPYDPLEGASRQGIAIHYPPGVERLIGSLSITGQLDDPRASQCQFNVPILEGDAYSQGLYHQESQLGCRASLVVDSAAPSGG